MLSRKVIATPLFARHLQEFLDEYAELGAVRFVERLRQSYMEMLGNITTFQYISPARRRHVQGKSIITRDYVLNAGARDFLVLYWVPADQAEPVVLLNIRIGGQNRFKWQD